MSKEHKLGIIGYGGMGKWHHLNMNKVDGVAAAAVFDISQEALNRAKAYGLRTYNTLDGILRDEDIDIITIATPNDFHCPYAIEAFKAGKHVITEKPAALSSGELQKMIDASGQYNRVFSVHQNRRWDNDYRTIKEIYDSNMLGRVYSIQSRVMGSRGIPGDWRAKKKRGGGMMLDWGVHLIDQALDVIKSKVTDVYVRMQHVNHTEVDDGFQLFITFECGLVYLIEVSTNAYINLPRWHMSGVLGTAVVDDWACSGRIVKRITGKETDDAKPIEAGAGLTKTMAPRTKASVEEFPLPKVQTNEWKEYYENFIKVIGGEAELIVRPGQVMRVMKIMEASFVSEMENRAVRVDI